jgi:WD40 repeat protein
MTKQVSASNAFDTVLTAARSAKKESPQTDSSALQEKHRRKPRADKRSIKQEHTPLDTVSSSDSAAPYCLESVPRNSSDGAPGLQPNGLCNVASWKNIQPLRTYVHQGAVHCLVMSPSGSVLLSASTRGSLCLWDAQVGDHIQLRELRDTREHVFNRYIEEYLTARFTPDERYVVAAGTRRDRHLWDFDESDCKVVPPAIKIFDIVSGEVLADLEGHLEEVFCVQIYRELGDHGPWMMMSCSQDGTVILWRFAANGTAFNTATKERVISLEALDVEQLDPNYVSGISLSEPTARDAIQALARQVGVAPNELNGESYIATWCALLPATAARYALVSVDTGLCVLDLKAGRVIAKFPALFTAICDSFLVLDDVDEAGTRYFSLAVHGVEALSGDGRNAEQIRPDRCLLCRLYVPMKDGDQWRLITEQELSHSTKYVSNVWPSRISAAAGQWVAAGTEHGTVCVWDLTNRGQHLLTLVGSHDNQSCVRDLIVHPTRPWLYSAADDGTIQVWAVPSPADAGDPHAPTSNGMCGSI